MGNVQSPVVTSTAEVVDTYSYNELQSMEALKTSAKRQSGKMVDTGVFDTDGRLPSMHQALARSGTLARGDRDCTDTRGSYATAGQAGRLRSESEESFGQSWRAYLLPQEQ